MKLSDILANPEEFQRRMQATNDQIDRERAENEARRAAFLAEIADQTPDQRIERIKATGLVADAADLSAWISQPKEDTADWLDKLVVDAQAWGFYD